MQYSLSRLCSAVAVTVTLLMSGPAQAAQIFVEFGGFVTEYFDGESGDLVEENAGLEVYGYFEIDTSTPDAGFGNYFNSVSSLEVFVDDNLFLSQFDFVSTGPGFAANDVFVDSFDGNFANVYVQDFFVGNIDLELTAADGVDLAGDIGVFEAAALGDVEDFFDPINGFGSVQVDDNFAFETEFLEMTVVPLPAAAWLFLSALAGLGLLKRRAG